jgi:CheY-like chemotaxis protein
MSLGVSGAPSALISGAYPQYSSASTAKFIPEIWSGKLQAKFYKSTVLSEITNNDWEGEIKGQGDKVYIRSIPTITVRSYVKGQNLTNEVPMSTPLELNIDKGQYFSVVLDDVDAVQADVKLMDMFTNDATEQMKIVIDTDVLNGVKAGAATANKGATAGAISGNLNLGSTGATRAVSKTNVLDLILDMGQEDVRQHVQAARSAIEDAMSARVLIIEDESIIALHIKQIVESLGHETVAIVRTRAEAVAMARDERPELVLADISLADGSSGIDAVKDILAEQTVPVIFITAFPERLLTGERPEPTYLITKPFEPETVIATIGQALLMHRDVDMNSKAA